MSTKYDQMYINIGKNIKNYRLEKNLSQEKLSEMLNVNSKFIGHIERFERFISLKKLADVAEILEVRIQDLFN